MTKGEFLPTISKVCPLTTLKITMPSEPKQKAAPDIVPRIWSGISLKKRASVEMNMIEEVIIRPIEMK